MVNAYVVTATCACGLSGFFIMVISNSVSVYSRPAGRNVFIILGENVVDWEGMGIYC